VSAGAEKIFHLGDLGGYNPFVNEVVDFLIEHGIEGIQGNYDETVANDRDECGCKYENPRQAELAHISFVWTKEHASARSKEFMRKLPVSLSLTVEGRKIILFHGAPHKNNLYWYEDRSDKFFLEMAEKVDADILVYGHTHKPYRKDIGGKFFINAGSVGRPKDGDSRTCVALIDIMKTGEVLSEFLRIPYDTEKAALAVVEAGLPAEFAEGLRKGA
jgi:putative phosphoesterase